MGWEEGIIADSDKGDVVWCEEKEVHITVSSDKIWCRYKSAGEVAIDYWSERIDVTTNASVSSDLRVQIGGLREYVTSF
jgi:hypothetical protein